MAVVYGLSDSGFVARRAAFILTEIRDFIETETGETFDWDADIFWAVVTAAQAQQVGEVEQALQAVYDAFDPTNSTGLQLDIIGAIRGIPRNLPTYSTATVTLTGTAGTIILAGKVVTGGGDDDEARWVLQEDVTIPAPGFDTATVQAEELGATTAAPGDIDSITTPVSGWTAVTNAAAASTGTARETDAEYRVRQETSLQIRGSTSVASVLAGLLDLDYIDAAVVIENDTGVAAAVGGVTVAAYTTAVFLLPNTLTTAQQAAMAEVIFDRLASGTPMQGGETATVTINALNTKTIRWEWGTDLTVNVATTVTLDTGFVLGDVDTDIEALIEAYFDAVTLGEDVHDSNLEALAIGVTGVQRVVCTLNAGTGVTPDFDERCVLGTNTVTT